jgi:hypothetical protein
MFENWQVQNQLSERRREVSGAEFAAQLPEPPTPQPRGTGPVRRSWLHWIRHPQLSARSGHRLGDPRVGADGSNGHAPPAQLDNDV